MKLNDWKLIVLLLVVLSLTVASFDNPGASGTGSSVPEDTANDKLVWHDNYHEALKQSRTTGKPIFWSSGAPLERTGDALMHRLCSHRKIHRAAS
jgi:hypothetical protein